MKLINFSSLLLSGTFLLLGMKTPLIRYESVSDVQVIGTIRLEGLKQGLIMGGKEGKNSVMDLNSFQWGPDKSIGINSVSSNKAGSSESTIVITKKIDYASANLHQAFLNKEGLKSVEIILTKNSPDGKQPVFKIIKLNGAMIQNVMKNGLAKKNQSSEYTFEEEEITFTFTHIDMLNENGKSDNSWDLSTLISPWADRLCCL